MALAFDTLAYARRLREAGFTEQQAEGQAEALALAMTDSLATKDDIRALEVATKQDIRALELTTKQDIGAVQVGLHELAQRMDVRFQEMDKRMDIRFQEMDKRMDIRFQEMDNRMDIRFREHSAEFRGQLADLERRMTMRLGGITVAGITVVSALVRLI